MSTLPAAVASPDDDRAADPVYRSIIVLDLEGSTMRTNLVKGELRRVMYDLLGRSLEAVAITGNRLESLTDRGDGVLALVRPHDEVPKTAILDRFIPLLTDLLTEHNAQAEQPALQMRLRAVVHAGEIHLDKQGCYGAAIDVAVRLLDAPRVKKALKQAAAPLVLVVSDEIHSGIVRHGYVDASTYFPIWARVGTRRHRGWVHVPALIAFSMVASPALSSRAAVASGSLSLTRARDRPRYPVAPAAGRAGVTRAGLAAS
jgi:hypothetical protein